MTPSEAWRRLLGLTGAVVALDQIAKQAAASALERGERIDIFFGLELANVRNKGIAFGLLSDGRAPVIAVTAAALAVMLAYFALNARRPGLWLAGGLLAGGALGNLADRVRIDAVIDFLDPPLWPAFNLADVSIVAGVLTLAYVLEGRRKAPA